jgi:hypothetical protein
MSVNPEIDLFKGLIDKSETSYSEPASLNQEEGQDLRILLYSL